MTTATTARCRFFLSYAHSDPLNTSGNRDTDVWVRSCFDDLAAAVGALVGEDPATVGFADYLLAPGTDSKARLTEQLGRAEVFVPLYSPGYFIKSWPMRERAVFLNRLARVLPGEPDAARAHLMPVLWLPFPDSGRESEVRSALPLGAGIPEYAENGLRALGRLTPYRGLYAKVVDRLAHRIAEVTSRRRLPAGRAVPIDEVAVPELQSTEVPFVIAVSAARGETLTWKPYGGALDNPIAEYAANVAERLGLPTRIIDRTGELKALDGSPGVVFVDPWQPGGVESLDVLAGHLHRWTTPIVVADSSDPRHTRYGADLVERTEARLTALGAARVYRALDVKQLDSQMASVVSEARRHFLRRAAVQPPEGLPRPRLGGSDPSARRVFGKSDDD
jgi:hypothetical protein